MKAKRENGIDRREALRRMGAAGAAVPLLTLTHHPLVPVAQGERWSARALGERELETLLALSEQIIPETDTPGARGAMVHQYIDYVVSEDAARKAALADALEWFDQSSRDAHTKAFSDLDDEAQVSVLTDAAEDGSPGWPYFSTVKQLTVEGYYRSEVGMIQELGFEGMTFVTTFDGCQHPEHHAFVPPGRNDGRGA